MRRSPASAAPIDITVYPVEEISGEELLQRWIVELFRPLLERYLAERKIRALTGADQFIARLRALTAKPAPRRRGQK